MPIILLGIIHRFTKGKQFIDSMSTPSTLRPDLRLSFLTYFSQTILYPIRRYEFGPVFQKKRDNIRCNQQGSIDNVWLQRWVERRELIVIIDRDNQSSTRTIYIWESLLLSHQLLQCLSTLMSSKLDMTINHTGVSFYLTCGMVWCIIDPYDYSGLLQSKEV